MLLLAPRRVGKTSLLHALVKRVERDGSAIAVYASVAATTNETQFVQAILKAIYTTTRGRKLKRGLVARALGLGRGREGRGQRVHCLGDDRDLDEAQQPQPTTGKNDEKRI